MDVIFAERKRKPRDWPAPRSLDEDWGKPYYSNKDMVVRLIASKTLKEGVIAYKLKDPTLERWHDVHIITKAAKISHPEDTISYQPRVVMHDAAGKLVWSHSSCPVVDSEVEKEFQDHAKKWSSETAHISSATELVLHPSYQRIIGLGPAVLPSIFRDLAREPRDWFWALRAITGGSPVKLEDAGNMRRMAAAWLDWGRQHGYI